MILHMDGAFFIEHATNRKGYYNARTRVGDSSMRDIYKGDVYRTENLCEASADHSHVAVPGPSLCNYLTASVIDHIVSHGQYVEWFGSTELLVKFSKRLGASRAWVGCVEFVQREQVELFDIYHEIAHHATLRSTEPHHGERFLGAYLLVASLSPYPHHARILADQLRKENLYPYANKYLHREFIHG